MSKPKRGSFESKQYSFIRGALRRQSLRWPERTSAFRSARVDRGLYVCAMCKNTHRNKDIILDHVDPVVDPVVGFTNWHDFALRLYCKAEGYQVLCNTCHEAKTSVENNIRMLHGQEPEKPRKSNKKKKKN